MAWSTLVAGQQRQHLLRSLSSFSVAKGSVFAEDDRATIEAAIQEWYGGGEAGAGGEKRDGIALFERELHEGKVHAAVHAALGGVSGFSVSDLFVAALPMYLDLLDYAFVNAWVWRGGERGGGSMVLTGLFLSAPVYTFMPIVLALLLVPASRGMARCGAVSRAHAGSTYPTAACLHSPWLHNPHQGVACPTGRSCCCSRPSASSWEWPGRWESACRPSAPSATSRARSCDGQLPHPVRIDLVVTGEDVRRSKFQICACAGNVRRPSTCH